MLIAGADHAVDLRVATDGVNIFPPADALDQFFADFAIARAAREGMFDAVDFRRLGQNRSAAVLTEDVHRRTQRGVGGDRRKPVRAAALQTDHQVTGGYRCAFHLVGFGQHFFHGGNTGLDGFARAAGVLHGEQMQPVAGVELLLFHQPLDLIALATQAHDHRAGQIGVARVARHGSPQ